MRGIITLSFIPLCGTQVSRGTDRSSLRGRKRLKERKQRIHRKGEKVNFPFIQETYNEHTYTHQEADQQGCCSS